MALICEAGHRRPFVGGKCAAKIGHRLCGLPIGEEPEVRLCSCRRGIFAGSPSYCSYCGRRDPESPSDAEASPVGALCGPESDSGFSPQSLTEAMA